MNLRSRSKTTALITGRCCVKCFRLMVVAAALLMSAVVGAQEEKMPTPAGILRLINTAQAIHLKNHGTFATWNQLQGSSEWAQAVSTYPVKYALGTSQEIVPGYQLRMFLADDKREYGVSLSRGQSGCDAAWFSNSKGLVYEGKPVGC
jgi:hypothetical protein